MDLHCRRHRRLRPVRHHRHATADGAPAAIDPSHHFGGTWALDVEVATNGQDADTATGPVIAVGDPVTWTYTVTNTGNQPLANVAVTDDQLGPIAGPPAGDIDNDGLLDPGETWTYTAAGAATAGQYANTGTARATTAVPASPGDPAAGTYIFEDLPPGTYTVSVVTADLPAGMLQTLDLDARLDATGTATLTSGSAAHLAFDFTGTGWWATRSGLTTTATACRTTPPARSSPASAA